MHLILIGSSLTMALFLGMLLCAEIGRRIGVARLNRSSGGLAAGAGAVDCAVVGMLLLPALNEMIGSTTTREMATRNHPPAIVFLLLCGLSLVGALLVGYGSSPNKERTWFHTVVFAGMLAVTVYVIADLEFPRLGL